MAMYGGKAITPNFDRFAELPGTVVFDRAYVQQAICCPTRSSFLTGRRPDTTKVWDLKTQFRISGGANWTTLPQFFRERGYWTAGMGKVRQQQRLPSIALLAHALHDDGQSRNRMHVHAQACHALCRANTPTSHTACAHK
jgi:arylsulfatase A-like enzyme